MPASDTLRRGAAAGLAGGLVFGAAMYALGMLPAVAGLIGVTHPAVGIGLHIAISSVVGALFAVLVAHQHPEAGETLFWGLVYGALWWFIGPLTLMPLIRTGAVAWDVAAAQAALPSLLGHLLYGATLGLAFVAARPARRPPGALLRGAVAGASASAVPAWLLGEPARLTVLGLLVTGPTSSLGLLVTWLALGALAGVGFAWLYPRPEVGVGVGLIRGLVFGLLWWVVVWMTLIPLAAGRGLGYWSLVGARVMFTELVATLLAGALLGLGYHVLDAAIQLLFARRRLDEGRDGPGSHVLRAVLYGTLAGLVGGLLFTGVMAQTGVLPQVAQLVGAQSGHVGLAVHLAISVLVGTSYGLLFRNVTFDVSSGLGWGMAYGVLWWLLGALTVMPLLLGGAPQWSARSAAAVLASLVGHIAYGSGLGVALYALEARHVPWWVPRSDYEAQRIEDRMAQLRSSAPALWALTLLIALLVPIVLGA